MIGTMNVYPELFFVPMSISTVVQIAIQYAILQSVTQLITQTERCSSPCFFYGSEHHRMPVQTYIIAYVSTCYRRFRDFRDMLIGSVYQGGLVLSSY